MEVILIVLVAALVAGGFIFAHLQAKKHREVLVGLATARGLDFDPSFDGSHDVRFARFAMFRKGRSRVAYNTISGTLDLGGRSIAVRTGDFRYKERRGSGKNRRTRRVRFRKISIYHVTIVTVYPQLFQQKESSSSKYIFLQTDIIT